MNLLAAMILLRNVCRSDGDCGVAGSNCGAEGANKDSVLFPCLHAFGWHNPDFALNDIDLVARFN